MFVVHSPLNTYLTDKGLPMQRERFTTWSLDSGKATLVTAEEFALLRKDWQFFETCDLQPALRTAVAA